MNEIDDMYKQNIEDIDADFIDHHNLGRTKSSTLNKYLFDVKKAREKFERDYEKHLKEEKWKVWHVKKKKTKKTKDKHLEVKHFDFEFNVFQKAGMKINIFFFEVKRMFSRNFVKVVPRLVFYIFYKIVKTTKVFFRDSREIFDRGKSRIISGIVKFFKNLYNEIKKKISGIIKKIKSKLPKGKDGDGGDSKDGDKEKEKESEDKEKKESS